MRYDEVVSTHMCDGRFEVVADHRALRELLNDPLNGEEAIERLCQEFSAWIDSQLDT
jgi:hypothetical protein